MMKFQDAPCHIPPRSIVMKRLMLENIFLRLPGRYFAMIPSTAAATTNITETIQLPERMAAITAKSMIQKNVPKVALRLPPRGM